MKRLVATVGVLVLAMALLLGPLAGAAIANHPAGSCLDLSPETDTNAVGDTHQVTATLRTPSGETCGSAQTAVQPTNGAVTIHFELTGTNDTNGNSLATPDFACTIQPSTTNCTISYSGASAGGDTIRGWVDETSGSGDADEQEGQAEAGSPGRVAEPDATDVVSKTWSNPSTASNLDCAPETAVNPAGTSHTVGCTARDHNGNLLPNANIDVEATGANDPDEANSPTSPDFTCQTTAEGTCQFTHATGTTTAGTTTYRAWVDAGNSNATSEADAGEGQDAAAQPGNVSEPDNTDVVSKTWTAGAAAELDCDDQTGPDTERETNPGSGATDPASAETYTCRVTDASNNVVSGAFVVSGEVETTVNDPDNPDSNSPASPDYQCTTSNGTCQMTVTQAENELGMTTICFWVGTVQEGSTLCADEATGENAATNGSDTGNDFADQVEKTWVSATTPTGLTISPTSDSASVGTCNAFTITVTNEFNQGVANVLVDIEQFHQLANDTTANNEPVVSFCTPTEGPNPATVNPDSGDRRPPSESPDNVGTSGGEVTKLTDASGRVTVGIAVAPSNGSDGSGTVTLTAFLETTDDDDPATNELPATATKTWLDPQARSIDCLPKTGSSATGANYVVSCTVRDRFGQFVAGEGVVFTSSGPGVIATATQVTTDAQGQATAMITSLDPGQQTLTATLADDLSGGEPADVDECDRVANDPAGAPAGVCSSSVTHTWTQAAAVTAVLSPQERTTRVGGRSTYTFSVLDANGRPIAGYPVTWTISGQGRFVSRDAQTDASGVATAKVTSRDPGNSVIAASATGCTAAACSDSSLQHWGPSYCTIFGTAGNDVLPGTSGADVICAFGGRDRIPGRGGDDVIFGGNGADTLRGGGGGDALRGGGGDDLLAGRRASDFLFGGGGDDFLNGNQGRDGCRGGPGRDRVRNCEGTILSGRQRQ